MLCPFNTITPWMGRLALHPFNFHLPQHHVSHTLQLRELYSPITYIATRHAGLVLEVCCSDVNIPRARFEYQHPATSTSTGKALPSKARIKGAWDLRICNGDSH